ncbi:hypothetical protein OIA45_48490 (plasmid) [Streptomyces chartreusis]|uniref:hypothetical protein n=1 Tax=Streptomyces chartreusis TaxID=1969 RepID=UPI0037DC1E25|nr:hypothetical protein OIA45_48490 [Streptomyces chartreusis]
MTETPEQPQAHGVRIDAQPGHATIVLDGTTLPADQITGYTLQHSIQDVLPLLVLHTRQPQGAVWRGLARVAVADPQAPDPSETIAAFLEAIDPEALENAALYRDDLGSGQYELTRAMLRQAAAWARGEQ